MGNLCTNKNRRTTGTQDRIKVRKTEVAAYQVGEAGKGENVFGHVRQQGSCFDDEARLGYCSDRLGGADRGHGWPGSYRENLKSEE